MADHLSLCTDRLITSESLDSEKDSDSSGESSYRPQGTDLASSSVNETEVPREYYAVSDEEEPLLQSVECRICQEEDSTKNLEAPCACNGSLKYAHRKCVQRWCNEKGDITCEICHQPYQHGYTAPPPPPPDETIIHIGDDWENGVPLDLTDPRILAMAAAERHFLEADYDEYSENNSSGAAFCRSAALILMALLLLRDALNLTTNPDDEDDPTAFFSLFLLRAAGFLLPCYIMAWAIGILQRRRQRQEAAALAAAEVTFMIHGGGPQRRGLHFAVAPQPPISNVPTPV
ncbi:Zinc finger RING-CH-type [Arabidopsis suecica]|uniref:Zinc finger RING-CH-type n=1 Tax=Arabidopsis suecica TaxID=45249 RepID=A0A8T2FCC4_ARASU|nr:Zinc finger RING-CH-type [Arabidopsis suecica]